MSATRPLRRRRLLALAAAAAALLALPLGAAPALAAQPAPVAKYVALGDSYAAGQGTGVSTNGCMDSPLGYPALLGAMPRINLLRDPSCTGATIAQVAGTQLAQVNQGTTLVTITAGADDLGIGSVYAACVADPLSAGCQAAIGQAESAIPTVGPAMAGLIAAVHQRAPQATIVVTGYPLPYSPAAAGMNPLDGVIDQAVGELDAGLAQAVVSQEGMGVRALAVPVWFTGHEADSASPWLGGDPADPATFLHPNAAGYAAYAAAIRAALP